MDQETLLREKYFEWLCRFAGANGRTRLLRYLFDTPFFYTLPRDGNRYEDGVNLRYRFGDETSCHYRYITAWLDNRDCSVLEMMVALALRIEEEITFDPDKGCRTERWVNAMLDSMGLSWVTDRVFNRDAVSQRVERMLHRMYTRNGDGGLFRLRHPARDLRSVEIWYQAMWYIDEVLNIK